MSGFAPGDVVVCVDDRPSHLGIERLRNGALYRVRQVGPPMLCIAFGRRSQVIFLREVSSLSPHGFAADRFRKIDPASESFTAEIRACRPIKHREPANA